MAMIDLIKLHEDSSRTSQEQELRYVNECFQIFLKAVKLTGFNEFNETDTKELVEEYIDSCSALISHIVMHHIDDEILFDILRKSEDT